jgi:hypothetical protein
MIVLGADMHKRSHTVAAVGAITGELLGEQTIQVGDTHRSATAASDRQEGKAIKSSRGGRRARHGAWWDLEFSVEPEQPSPKALLGGPCAGIRGSRMRWRTSRDQRRLSPCIYRW